MATKSRSKQWWWTKVFVPVVGSGGVITLLVTGLKSCGAGSGGVSQNIHTQDVNGNILQANGPITFNEAANRFESVQPRLSRPYDGLVTDAFPRSLTLVWETLPEAVSYEVELQWQHLFNKTWHTLPDYPKALQQTVYVTEFVGAQPGRCRVVAINKSGRRSQWSDWRYFTFTR